MRPNCRCEHGFWRFTCLPSANKVSPHYSCRDLGVSHNTVWQLKHKILEVMRERCDEKLLAGRIEIDDAYLGGERPGPRRRRQGAIETTEDGRPLKAKFRRVSGFTNAAIKDYTQAGLTAASHVVSDGLGCFRVFGQLNYNHERIISGGGRASVETPAFTWVNTLLGNVKTAIVGNLHAVGPKHIPRYLTEHVYRFNRRFDLPAMIERFAYVALRTAPMPHRLLKMAKAYT